MDSRGGYFMCDFYLLKDILRDILKITRIRQFIFNLLLLKVFMA